MHRQRGNALFLILIAVALFAALSYAVTRSGRGGGGINRENSLIAASEITQYLSGVRSVVTRMILTGVAESGVNFDPEDVTDSGVFSPSGGGYVYANIPANVGNATDWGFASLEHPTRGVYITDIGTNTDVTGRDALAGLADISLAVCTAINNGVGVANPPANNSPTADGTAVTYDIGSNVIDAYPGQPFACVNTDNGSGVYLYYHALIEN